MFYLPNDNCCMQGLLTSGADDQSQNREIHIDVIYNLSNETKVFTAKMQLWVLNAQKSDLYLFSMLISLFGI